MCLQVIQKRLPTVATNSYNVTKMAENEDGRALDFCYNVYMVDLFGTYRAFFVAGTLGAHSNFAKAGFRQKDVRFLIGLFLNWVESVSPGADEAIHNTQILRYLEKLKKEGFATRTGQGQSSRYFLTRAGLLELVSQLTRISSKSQFEHFFFVYFFVRTYGERLTELVRQKESRLPRSFEVELSALLDHHELLALQVRAIEIEIKKLESRIAETKAAKKMAEDFSRKGMGADEIVRLVEEQFPYELNSAKPMSDLFREIPPVQRMWELTTGNHNRVQYLLAPLKKDLQGYLETLKGLKE